MAVGPMVGKKLAIHPSPSFPLEEIRLADAPEDGHHLDAPDRLGGDVLEPD